MNDEVMFVVLAHLKCYHNRIN